MNTTATATATSATAAHHRIGLALVFCAVLSWSTAGLFTRVVGTDLATTLLWRAIVGGLCVLGGYALFARTDRRESPLRLLRFSRGELIVAALTAGGMLCYIAAFFHTTIANVAVMYGTVPLMTAPLAYLILRERVSALAIACCLACALGVGVMVNGAQRFDDLFGIALGVGMSLFMAAMTIAAKYFPQASMVKATYLSAFLCALVAAPFASSPFSVTLSDYLWLALYGLVTVAFGFGAYLIGAQRIAALTATLISMVEIPLAPLLAWWVFAEAPGGATALGGAVVMAAALVYLLANQTHARVAAHAK
ncbi:MAG: DMT family transporter [bacterium]